MYVLKKTVLKMDCVQFEYEVPRRSGETYRDESTGQEEHSHSSHAARQSITGPIEQPKTHVVIDELSL
jgi:hypothetical protein